MGNAAGTVNLLAVFLAALSAFILGGLWYSPLMFFKPWKAAAKLSDDDLKARDGRAPMVFGGAFVLALIGAFVFAMFLGPSPAMGFAVGAGASAGICWVAGSFGINYLFETRSLKLFLINGGYHTVQFTLYGVILSFFG